MRAEAMAVLLSTLKLGARVLRSISFLSDYYINKQRNLLCEHPELSVQLSIPRKAEVAAITKDILFHCT